MGRSSNLRWAQLYDNIYGYIRLTETESKIVNTPYFQRLRWIRQLGFANYIFDGAEHTRFAHAAGVLHSADQMVRAIGRGVPDDRLFNEKALDSASIFHKSIRIAALLHDIGTFPFSHVIEWAYIRHGKKLAREGRLPGKQLPSNHEHLGSFIIKNTDCEGGITRVLRESGLDAAMISKFIKGDSADMVANQILHSDIDADRMDYLIRDAHHTGLKYGHVDRDYILYHLTTARLKDGTEVLAINDSALHAVEDFLIARFSWYSQVVRNQGSAKFDVLAAHLAEYLLEKKIIFSFQDLLDMVESKPERFFGFNDHYFMTQLQELYWSGKVNDPILKEQMQMLIYRISPKLVQLPESTHRMLEASPSGGAGAMGGKKAAMERLHEKLRAIEGLFQKHGRGTEWIIADIPEKDVIFTKDLKELRAIEGASKTKLDRDSVKLVDRHGKFSLLVERENTLISRLAGVVSFQPNIYCNDAALKLLKRRGAV